MVIVIVQDKGKLRIDKISRADWDTAMTAINWKRNGIWTTVKYYVYRRKLLVGKPKRKEKVKIRHGFLKRLLNE